MDQTLYLIGNPLLDNFCGLSPLFRDGTVGDGYKEISGNGIETTIEQIIEDCSSTSPEDLIANLIASVNESGIHKGTMNSLNSSLENALKSFGERKYWSCDKPT